MDWFQTNPYGNKPSFMQAVRWDVHKAGRQMFMGNFSRNGMSAMLFAPTPKAAFNAAIGKTIEFGSPQHIANLERLATMNPGNEAVGKALARATAKKSLPKSLFRKTIGMGMGIGFEAGMSAITGIQAEGDIVSKTRAGVADFIGFQAFKPGMAVGAAIGTAIMPVIGTAVGALAGGLAAQIGVSQGVNAVFNQTDRMVQRERDRRNLNWVGDMTAFNTQNAYTMRQQSLSAMNRGMATGRSALGREAVMVHR